MHRRKWVFVFAIIALIVIGTIIFQPSAPVKLQFIGFGTDGTGVLLLSNRIDRELEFTRPDIEILDADGSMSYVQRYLIRSHLLPAHGTVVLRVDLPAKQCTWKATVTVFEESKFRSKVESFLRRVGIERQLPEARFDSSIVILSSTSRSQTNASNAHTGVWEVIRVPR